MRLVLHAGDVKGGSQTYLPTERLEHIREVFYPRPGLTLGQRPPRVETQADDPEHPAYVEDVLFERSRRCPGREARVNGSGTSDCAPIRPRRAAGARCRYAPRTESPSWRTDGATLRPIPHEPGSSVALALPLRAGQEHHPVDVTRAEIKQSVGTAFIGGGAGRFDLIHLARASRASDDVLAALATLPERRFTRLLEVWDYLPDVPAHVALAA